MGELCGKLVQYFVFLPWHSPHNKLRLAPEVWCLGSATASFSSSLDSSSLAITASRHPITYVG